MLRDVTLPRFAINPDFLASIVTLKDGRFLTGAIRNDSGKLLVGDKDGKVRAVARDEIEKLLHSPLSIMPEGVPQKLGPERMRDLLTFLLTEPPHMPSDAKLPPQSAHTGRSGEGAGS